MEWTPSNTVLTLQRSAETFRLYFHSNKSSQLDFLPSNLLKGNILSDRQKVLPKTVSSSQDPFGIDQNPSTDRCLALQQGHEGQRVGLHFFPVDDFSTKTWAHECNSMMETRNQLQHRTRSRNTHFRATSSRWTHTIVLTWLGGEEDRARENDAKTSQGEHFPWCLAQSAEAHLDTPVYMFSSEDVVRRWKQRTQQNWRNAVHSHSFRGKCFCRSVGVCFILLRDISHTSAPAQKCCR